MRRPFLAVADRATHLIALMDQRHPTTRMVEILEPADAQALLDSLKLAIETQSAPLMTRAEEAHETAARC